MRVTASDKQRFVKVDQVVDRNTSPGQKWFSLSNNTLDGSFHPVGLDYALGFDGDNAEANAGTAGLGTGNVTHSIQALIFIDKLPDSRMGVLDLLPQSTGGHHWLLATNGTMQTGIWSGGTGGQVSPTVPIGKRFLYTVTFDSAANILRAYVDGALVAESDTSSSTGFSLSGGISLGEGVPSEISLLGYLKNVSVWDRALSQSEIQNNLEGTYVGSETGLIAYWKLSEGHGNTINDSTANGNNGTTVDTKWVPFDTIDDVGLLSSNKADNNGVLQDYGLVCTSKGEYIEIPHHYSLNMVDEITIEAIITPESTMQSHGCICTKNRSYYFQVMSDGKLACYTYYDNAGAQGASAYTYSLTALTWGQTYHVAFTEKAGTRRLYINGVLDVEELKESSIWNGLDALRIGKEFGSRQFAGVIHEVRLWNVARTQQQLQDNANIAISSNEIGLVGYWKLNEGQGNVVGDYTINNNYGVGYLSKHLIDFDGTDDYVAVPNSAALQIIGSQTIEMWIKPDVLNDGVRRNPYNKAYGGEGTITQEPSGRLSYYWGTAGGNASPYQGFSSGVVLTAGQWHHIAIVRDLTNMKLHWIINGRRVTSVDAAYTEAVASTNDVWIGDGYVSHYDGKIRDVRIWNIARTEEQIANNMYNELVGNETGLVAYYKFNENGGTVLNDSAGTNDGTIYGTPAWLVDHFEGSKWTTFNKSTTINIDYEGTQSVHRLRVTGDELLNAYPVDFDITLYDGTGAAILSESVVGNTLVNWEKQLASVVDAASMKVEVYKINKAGDTIHLLETSEQHQIIANDSGAITNAEQSRMFIGVFGSDAVSVTAAADTSMPVTNMFSRQDASHVSVTDTSFFRLYEFKKADSSGVSITEVDSIAVTFSSTDTSTLTDAFISHITAQLTKQDSLGINHNVERDHITVDFASKDTATMASSDISIPTNIHTVMDEPLRKIYGKVEITYTDPFLDEDINATASTVARHTSPNETTDTHNKATYKWFSLQDNLLDGSFHPIPTDLEDSSVGWWGTVMSDSTGLISPTESLKISFATRGVFKLKVAGDDKLNEFPVDFDIILYDGAGTALLTRSVTGNTKVLWEEACNVTGVASMELKVYKVNKALRTVKIVEFFTALVEVYDDTKLISMDLLEEQTFTDMTLPIGNASSNEIDVRLDNTSGRFDPDNTDSPLYGWLKKNRRIKAWLGAEIIPGQIEWYQLGLFWTQDWNSPESALWVETTGLDRLELLRLTDFTTSQVYQNYNLYDVTEIILKDAGLKTDEYSIDTALANTVVPYVWFDRMSHRAALIKVAQAALGRVYCDRQGRVVVSTFNTTSKPIYFYDYTKNIIDLDRPLALSQITNNVEVTSKPRTLQATQEVYNNTETITIPPGEYYSETIYFNEVPVANAQSPTITASSTGISVHSYTAYAWGMDVTFVNNDTVEGTISKVAVQGDPLKVAGQRVAIAKDEVSIRDNGKQSYSLESDFIQSYQLANTVAKDILDTYSNPRHDAAIQSRGNISLLLGDRVAVPTKQGSYIDHFITRQTLNWAGSLDSSVDAQVLK